MTCTFCQAEVKTLAKHLSVPVKWLHSALAYASAQMETMYLQNVTFCEKVHHNWRIAADSSDIQMKTNQYDF